ncbi:MAG: riboflavin synthase [Chthonomonadales bacterium]
MFTGIIQEVGTVARFVRRGSSAEVAVAAPGAARGAEVGDSIAVNGVCLTVRQREGPVLVFDAVAETLNRSNLKRLRAGEKVNIEQALRVGDAVGGHFVQGHVDGVAEILSIKEDGNARILEVSAPRELARYLAPKGSVALDGISLTIAATADGAFRVWIVPHTWEATNLRYRTPGAELNVEVDIVARYLERLVADRAPRGVTMDQLLAAGFLDAGEAAL